VPTDVQAGPAAVSRRVAATQSWSCSQCCAPAALRLCERSVRARSVTDSWMIAAPGQPAQAAGPRFRCVAHSITHPAGTARRGCRSAVPLRGSFDHPSRRDSPPRVQARGSVAWLIRSPIPATGSGLGPR
jgi:hypothetical protein